MRSLWPALKSNRDLIALSTMALVLLGFRVIKAENYRYLFLIWNLFLAFLPWLMSSRLLQTNGWLPRLGLIVLWGLFFPNAPYIITDFVHFKRFSDIIWWYDILCIGSFAMAGLYFGFRSLNHVSTFIGQYVSRRTSAVLIGLYLFLTAFGIYLGRFGRWNSWDIVRDPIALSREVIDIVLNPSDNEQAWLMTVVLGLFLNVLYWFLGRRETGQARSSLSL